MIEWKEVLQDILSGAAVLAIGGVGGWFTRIFLKEKKDSTKVSERKNEIYQPLIYDLEKYSNFNWTIREKVKVSFLSDVVNNQYKFALDEELFNNCNYLYSIISEYNRIDSIKVAHSVIVDIFKEGYKEIYGSIIAGVVSNIDRYGNEWEEEIIAAPVMTIQELNFSKDIENLLLNEGIYADEVCVDAEESLYLPIYLQLKTIYQQSLNVVINGQKYVNPQPIIELKMLPEEYIALNYDFFERYNNDCRIIRKNELREEIIYGSQAIVQDLKERIEKIIKKYELEEV